MRSAHHSRGNVILLVVGVLAVLAMVGSAFLMIAWADKKEALATSDAASMRPVAEGLLSKLNRVLVDDLYTGLNGPPFSDTGLLSGADLWASYTDYPSEDVDQFLACTLPEEYAAGDWRWRHLTNLDGIGPRTDYEDLPVDDASLVDTDGDGVLDSRLLPTGVYDARGVEYYYAMRVVDLLSLINVNTAYTAGTYADYTTPSSIDLKRILNAATGYDEVFDGVGALPGLHRMRCGRTPPTAAPGDDAFNDDMVMRLLEPTVDYRPFDAADELTCRWLKNADTAVSRLYGSFNSTNAARTNAYRDALLNPPWNLRSALTTYGTDRLLPRRPGAVAKVENIGRESTDTDANAYMERLYEQFLELAPDSLFSDQTRRERAAAHFAANLCAYISAAPVSFVKNGTTYFGLKPPPIVISEAYAKGINPPLRTCYAIELRNLTGAAIPLNGWKLNSTDLDGSVPANGYLVLYRLEGYVEADVGLDAVSNKRSIPDLDLAQGNTVYLYDPNGMPVDQVSPSDIENFSLDVNEKDGDYVRSDDATNTAHALVAQYVKNGNPGHTLGEANLVTDVGLSYAVPIVHYGDFAKDIGQLSDVYFTGPRVPTSPLNPEPLPLTVAIRSSATAMGNGRLSYWPAPDQTIEPGGFSVTANSHQYPDVPFAALVQEVFSVLRGDPTPSYAGNLYGRVNINTATPLTLQAMPMSSTIAPPDSHWDKIADLVFAYRDQRATTRLASMNMDYSSPKNGGPGRSVPTGIQNLRKVGESQLSDPEDRRFGYLAVGEIAIPLAQYYIWTLFQNPPAGFPMDFGRDVAGWKSTHERDLLYRQVSNLLTVRSDTFAVYIHVQLGNEVDPTTNIVKRNYVAVVDRSNVVGNGDTPVIRFMAEMK